MNPSAVISLASKVGVCGAAGVLLACGAHADPGAGGGVQREDGGVEEWGENRKVSLLGGVWMQGDVHQHVVRPKLPAHSQMRGLSN